MELPNYASLPEAWVILAIVFAVFILFFSWFKKQSTPYAINKLRREKEVERELREFTFR